MSIELEDIESFPDKRDFRRANGAPLVLIEGKQQRLSRPSSYGKCLDDESALTNWRINRAIAGTAMFRDIAARATAAKDDDHKAWQKLRDDAIAAGRGAESADLGTALHSMSERWEDPDDDFDPPDIYKLSLQAYSAEMERLGLVSDAFEFATVNFDYRAAGTCDRLYRLTQPLKTPKGTILPVGTKVIGDLKTGKRLDYSLPSYAIQLAIYAQGQWYDVVEEEFIDTPEINQEWAILVWLPVETGACQMIWVDLEEGNYGAWLAHEVKQWRAKWRSGRIPAPSIPNPVPGVFEMLRQEFGAREVDSLAWIRERVTAIRRHDAAKDMLLFKWPEGVPPPRHLSEPDHIERVQAVLVEVERRFELPFVPAPLLNDSGAKV